MLSVVSWPRVLYPNNTLNSSNFLRSIHPMLVGSTLTAHSENYTHEQVNTHTTYTPYSVVADRIKFAAL